MRAVVLSLAISAVGCVNGATSSTTQDETARNQLASNQLASNQLASNQLASNQLASNQLASNQFSANELGASALLATADGRHVMSYIVSCALPSPDTLVASSSTACTADADCADLPEESGNTTFAGACGSNHTCSYTFSGVVGVAPDWLKHPLDKTSRRWVSACLFSRINGFATAEEISLRGENDALVVAPDEQLVYSLEEGAFWGDVFRPAGEGILWVACTGRDNTGAPAGGLTLRECARPDPANPGYTKCGFFYAGDCASLSTVVPTKHACKNFETAKDHAFYYDGCHIPPVAHAQTDADDGTGRPHGLRTGGDAASDGGGGDDTQANRFEVFDEVVTTFVAP